MYALIFLKYIESFGRNLFANEAASERRIEKRNKIAMLRREESRRPAKVGGNSTWERKKRGKTDESSGLPSRVESEGRKQREVYTA